MKRATLLAALSVGCGDHWLGSVLPPAETRDATSDGGAAAADGAGAAGGAAAAGVSPGALARSLGAATLVERDEALGLAVPDVAIDARGRAVAAFTDPQRGRVLVTRLAPGAAWEAPRELTTKRPAPDLAARVAVDANGDGAVVWTEAVSSSSADVWAARLFGDGAVGPAALVETLEGKASSPALAFTAGEGIVAWIVAGATGESLASARWAGGVWQSAVVPGSDGPLGALAQPLIGPAGPAATLLWQRRDPASASSRVAAHQMADGAWKGPTVLDTDAASTALAAGVDPWCAWRRSSGELRAARLQAGTWSDSPIVAPTADHGLIAAASDGRGGAFVVWAASGDVKARAVTAAGPGAELQLSASAGALSSLSVGADDRGAFVAVWIESDGGPRLRAGRCDASRCATTVTVADATKGPPAAPRVAVAPDGRAVIVWTQAVSATSPGLSVWSASLE